MSNDRTPPTRLAAARRNLQKVLDEMAGTGQFRVEEILMDTITDLGSLEGELGTPPRETAAADKGPGLESFAKAVKTLSSTPAATYNDLQWSYAKFARAMGEDQTDDGVLLALETLTKGYIDSLSTVIGHRNPTISAKNLLMRVQKGIGQRNDVGAKIIRDAVRAYKLETD